MSKNIFELNVAQVRTITRDLHFYPEQEDGKGQEIKTHFLYITLKNLPANIPTGPNPRHADLTAKPCKQMFETLEKEPELFTDCNRGLFLLAEKVHFPNEGGGKKLIVDFGLDEDGEVVGGLVDGNHSYQVLQKVREDSSLNELPIFVTIIEGADQFAVQLARARNVSVQVDEKSISNLDKEFDPLKEALASYADRIIWVQNQDLVNEQAVVPAEELMARLTAINLDLYDNDHHPTVAYTGSATCLHKWLNKQKRPTYEKLYPNLRSALEAYEHLYEKYEDYAKAAGRNRLGAINGIEKSRGTGKNKRRLTVVLPFSKVTVGYKLSNGFILPIFAALRFLFKEVDGVYQWEIEPKKFLDQYGPKLVGKLLDAHTYENGGNPNKTGKSRMLWENIAQTVINQALQERLNDK